MIFTTNIEGEKHLFYHSYSFLKTIIHNYAISNFLLKNELYSWGITSGYYELVQTGRLYCFIASQNYPKTHLELHEFLSGKRDCFYRKPIYRDRSSRPIHYIRDKIIESIIEIDNNSEDNFRNLGNELEYLSKIRNNNSYDPFIIAHQINHEILEPEFEKLSEIMNCLNKKWLCSSFRLFLRYLKLLENKKKYLGLLLNKQEIFAEIERSTEGIRAISWGIPTVLSDLEQQGLAAESKEISNIWEEFLNKEINFYYEPIDTEFARPIFYSNFNEKNSDFNSFKSNITKLSRVL